MPILTTTCPECDQTVPVLTEQTTVATPTDIGDGKTEERGVFSNVKFIAPHNFLVGVTPYKCPKSASVVSSTPVN